MCGRYELGDSDADIQALPAGCALKTAGEVRPTDTVAVRTAMGLRAMRWGFARPDGGITINARAETLLDKPMFRQAALDSRCLVPARHYYEWERLSRQKTKYSLRPQGDAPLFFAGVCRAERDQPLPAFVIVTCAAAADIGHIHDRMPVMLTGNAARDWLAPDANIAQVLSRARRDIGYQAATPEQTTLW